jgi:hypothetical protein
MLHEDWSKWERFGGALEYNIIAFLVLNTLPTFAPTKPKISKLDPVECRVPSSSHRLDYQSN